MHHVSCDHHPQKNIFSDKPRLRLTLGRTLNPSEIKVTGSFLSCFVSNLTNIQEGDDVYFECRIVSNPEATKLEWYHEASFDINFTLCQHKLYLSLSNIVPILGTETGAECIRGHPSFQSVSRYPGIIIRLRIKREFPGLSRIRKIICQGVKKKNNGAYTCRAQNSQGEATSNAINLSIKCKYISNGFGNKKILI